MKSPKRTVLLIMILGLEFTIANLIDLDDDLITIEDEDHISSSESLQRFATVLWSYISNPHQDLTDYKQNMTQVANKSSDTREKRFIPSRYLYPQDPIMDKMMQSISENYFTNNKDILDFLRDKYPLPKGFTHPLDEYDYVIVGAGSAGSVLASRLTEDEPRATVLLIEAGKPEMLLSDVPMLVPYLQLCDYSWPYTVEYQPGVCLGSVGQRCYWPRGKAVGGSSVTNYMLYTRGRPQDWNRIAADGNYGWSYDEVLPYFMKSQKSKVKKYKNATYSGRDGELVVSNAPFRTKLVEAFLEAGRIHGNPTLDYNAPYGFGFGYTQATINRGHRWSAAKAFLHPHKRRRNLHILPETRATKVIIDPHTKRAYAVEYIRNNIKYTVRCRREIILSAGPIASPQLLMLSGVGPKKHLETLGIPVIADLQVGRTMYDHVSFPGVIFQLNTTNVSLLEPKVATVDNLVKWLHFGEGFLASAATIEAIGYIKTKVSDDPEPVPDIELLSLATSLNIDDGGIFRKSLKITDETYYTAFGSLRGKDTWSAIPMLLHPKSVGYLELRDNNPFSHPKLYSNYFTDPRDIKTMIAAIRYIIKLGNSEPFKKLGAELHHAQYPGCEGLPFGSDSYWECALRTLVITLYHPMATCKMGPTSDPEAIVDPELRVYGVEGLRVVDSSVIPRTISAHTNAPAIMIGERAADLIKHTWSWLSWE